MGKVTVMVNGIDYPCRVTMGAFLRFKGAMGKDVSKMDPSDLSELVTFMWCCVASACAADNLDFPLTLMEFADALSDMDMQTFYRDAGFEDSGGEGKKKEVRPPLT